MVRLIDVAKRCGVSVATVSKALSDKKDIGEETKEQIRRVCDEMGYLPNSSARALRLNRTYNLGVLLMMEDRSGLTHAYFSPLIEAFRAYADQCGYDTTFISKGRDASMSYLERARYRGVDGVLVVCADYTIPEVEELLDSGIPVMTVDDYYPDPYSSVISDNEQGMRDLVDFICDRGHNRIAYIYGHNTEVTRNRIDAFYKTLQKRGIIAPDYYVRSGAFRNPQLSYDVTMELLDLYVRPTCIIYPDDFSAMGGLNAIKERGFRIPEDISIAGYDGAYISQILEPKLTTIRQDAPKIGRIAAEKLIGRIENPKGFETEKILVRGELLEGSSVGIIGK